MSKIYQSIDKLVLELKSDGSRPIAKTMISCVGKEDVNFEQPL